MDVLEPLLETLKEAAKEHRCSFVRLSPHWPKTDEARLMALGGRHAPLHLLGEHLWYLPLRESDPWSSVSDEGKTRDTDEIFKQMRSTTRNLIRRAEKDGVTIERSADAVRDLHFFLTLHDETRQRHGFTPYADTFFRTQVAHFFPRGECTLYLARYQGEVIAASIHMHTFGETSYHHGASTHRHRKIPSSYLLQWTAIQDALARGDGVYNFWGIAPINESGQVKNPKHPFAGVTLFKTGFGGRLLDLVHCTDIALSARYHVTRSIERVRKWRRGF